MKPEIHTDLKINKIALHFDPFTSPVTLDARFKWISMIFILTLRNQNRVDFLKTPFYLRARGKMHIIHFGKKNGLFD